MKYLAAAALVLGACTTESHDIAFTIGYDDAPFVPAYIAYRDGNGPWQTPARTATGTYTLHVTDTYEVIYVCTDDAGAFDIEELRADADEGAYFTAFPTGLSSGTCAQPPGSNPAQPFQVTGTTARPSGVAFGGTVMNTSSLHETFSASVAPGTYPLFLTDLVGPNAPAARVSKRMVAVTGNVDLGTLDLASDALPTEPMMIPVHGSISPGSWFVNGPWGLQLALDTNRSGSAAIPLLAASQRDPNDHYEGFWSSGAANVSQGYVNTQAELATSIELITPPQVAFADAPFAVTWLPDDVSSASLRFQRGGGAQTRNAMATPRWLARTGTTKLTFADDPPNFPATWALDTSGTYYLSLWLQRHDGTAYSDVRIDR